MKMPMLARPPSTLCAGWSRPQNGSVQPPKNSVTIIADECDHVGIFAMKNIANFIELYSVL